MKKTKLLITLLIALTACSQSELDRETEHSSKYHNLTVEVDSDSQQTRAANPEPRKVSINDLILFTVDKKSHIILDTARMEKSINQTYHCRIPSKINLAEVLFFAVANVKANFSDQLSDIETKKFEEFLNIPILQTTTENNPSDSGSSELKYALINRAPATYNNETRTLSPIKLSHLPSRIFLDCKKLGYPVEKVVISSICTTASLLSLFEDQSKESTTTPSDFEDPSPRISGKGENYYYLVYPSGQPSSITITANGQSSTPIHLGEIKAGRSYTVRINYPEEISLERIDLKTPIQMIPGEQKEIAFEVNNTAMERKIALISSDESVFTVKEGTGLDWYKFFIIPIKQGSATLTAVCDGYESKTTVIVGNNNWGVSVNGEFLRSYEKGETVKLNAPFEERKKFVRWMKSEAEASNSLVRESIAPYSIDYQSPTISFIMPDAEVQLRVEYADAPHKMTINKPGRIINSRNGDFEEALVQEDDYRYTRYYTDNEEVCIETPPSASTAFKYWEKSESTHTQIYFRINNQGGGQKSTTWFNMLNSDSELTPTYHKKPYWSTRTTNNGHIIANFIEENNTLPSGVTIPGGAPLARALNEQEKNAIMRALNTIENTFSNTPARTIKITFAMSKLPPGVGAAAEPTVAKAAPGYDTPKLRWSSTDFGGIASDMVAASSKFESVWRDQKKLIPDDADENNDFVGQCDGYVLFDSNYADRCYKGENENGISNIQVDFETLAMHELGHIVCYHSYNKAASPTNGMFALDVFVGNVNDHNLRITNGNMVAAEGGEAIILSELVKSYYGSYLAVNTHLSWDFGHLHTQVGAAVGSYARAAGACRRRFTDFELALLQEMGWKINPRAWQRPPVPFN